MGHDRKGTATENRRPGLSTCLYIFVIPVMGLVEIEGRSLNFACQSLAGISLQALNNVLT